MVKYFFSLFLNSLSNYIVKMGFPWNIWSRRHSGWNGLKNHSSHSHMWALFYITQYMNKISLLNVGNINVCMGREPRRKISPFPIHFDKLIFSFRMKNFVTTKLNLGEKILFHYHSTLSFRFLYMCEYSAGVGMLLLLLLWTLLKPKHKFISFW